jgi:hypothetical protein
VTTFETSLFKLIKKIIRRFRVRNYNACGINLLKHRIKSVFFNGNEDSPSCEVKIESIEGFSGFKIFKLYYCW